MDEFTRDFLLQVADGRVEGHSLVHKFGAGSLTQTIKPITNSGNYQTPQTAVSLEIVSDDEADALNGVGAREYTVVGIDANGNEQEKTVSAHATDGTIAVAVGGTWLRVHRWFVSKSGVYATQTTGSHVGSLTLRVTGAGATWSEIGITPFAIGQSQIGVYTVPKGKRAFLLSKNIFVDGGKTADIYFFKRENILEGSAPYSGTMRLVEREVGVVGGYGLKTVAPKTAFPELTDIGFMGKVDSTTTEASVEFELLLIDDRI